MWTSGTRISNNMAVEDHPGEHVKKILSSLLVGRESEQPSTKQSGEKSDGDKTDIPLLDHADSQAFYQRVETYTTLKWLAKPLELSPLICSQYGWENCDTDMLKCVSCKAIVCGQLPAVQKTNVYKESYNKLKTSLIESHHSLCPWRSNPTPDSFIRPFSYSPTECLSNVKSAYTDLLKSQLHLPVISFQTLEEIGLDEEKFTEEIIHGPNGPGRFSNSSFQNPTKNIAAFCLSLFGWRRSDSMPEVIVCEKCRRKVGLWAYKLMEKSDLTTSRQDDEHSDAENTENSSRKKQKLSLKDGFDPISEHKAWCPWLAFPIVPNASHLSSGISGNEETPSKRPCASLSAEGTSSCNPSSSNGHNLSTPPQTPVHRGNRHNSQAEESMNISWDSGQFSFTSGQTPTQLTNYSNRELSHPHPWKVLLILLSLWKPENLSSRSALNSSSPVEGMSQIRRLIRDWTSPRSLRRVKLL